MAVTVTYIRLSIKAKCTLMDEMCICCAFVTAIVGVLLLVEQVFIYSEYQAEKRAPEYFVKYGFELKKINITGFNAAGSDLTGGCHVLFNVTNNSGKLDFLYERGIVSVYYDKILTWVTTTSPFYQVVSDTAIVEAVAPKTTISLPMEYVPRAMLRRKNIKGNIGTNFEVRFTAMVHQGLGGYSSGTQPLDVRCSKIPTQFVDDNVIVGGPASCVVQSGNHPLPAFQTLFF